MNKAEAAAVQLALLLLNEAQKARALGSTDAIRLEAEARTILADLLKAQDFNRPSSSASET